MADVATFGRKKAKKRRRGGASVATASLMSFATDDEDGQTPQFPASAVQRPKLKKKKKKKDRPVVRRGLSAAPVEELTDFAKGEERRASSLYSQEALQELREQQESFPSSLAEPEPEPASRMEEGAILAGDELLDAGEDGQRAVAEAAGLLEEKRRRRVYFGSAAKPLVPTQETLAGDPALSEDFIPFDAVAGHAPEKGSRLLDLEHEEERIDAEAGEGDAFEQQQIERTSVGILRHKGKSVQEELDELTKLHIDVESVEKRLNEALLSLEDAEDQFYRKESRIVSELQLLENDDEDKLAATYGTEQALRYHQDMRTYLVNLVACLRTKQQMINDVLQGIQQAHKGTFEDLRKVRTLDVEDAIMEFQKESIVWDLNGYEPRSAALKRDEQQEEPERDEFGRSKAHYQETGSSRRREQAERRRQAILNKKKSVKTLAKDLGRVKREPEGASNHQIYMSFHSDAHILGDCSGSGLEEDVGEAEAKRDERIAKFLRAADVILDDVDPEYGDVLAISRKFEEWKRDFPEQYAQTFASLSLPDLLKPLVDLQIIRWQPLLAKEYQEVTQDEDAMDVDDPETAYTLMQFPGISSFAWHKDLFDFAQHLDRAGDDDEDANLIPKLVEKSVLPLVLAQITEAYDVHSRRQTANLVESVSELLVYDLPFEAMKSLLAGVEKVIAAGFRSVALPLFAEDADCGPSAAPLASDFLEQQLYVASKVTENACRWISQSYDAETPDGRRAFDEMRKDIVTCIVGFFRDHVVSAMTSWIQSGLSRRAAELCAYVLQTLALPISRVPGGVGAVLRGQLKPAVDRLLPLLWTSLKGAQAATTLTSVQQLLGYSQNGMPDG